MKCKKCFPTGAAPASERARQRARNNPNRVVTSRVGSSSKGANAPTSWTVNGPNTEPIVPRGTVLRSYTDVVASAPGKFLTIDFSERFPNLLGHKVRILSILLRVNAFHSNGWVGLVEDYDVSSPTGPDPMRRKGFMANQARGWQWMAPSGLEYDDFAKKHRIVLEFKTEFAAEQKVLTRDLYVVTTELPKVTIPGDILFVDEDLLDV